MASLVFQMIFAGYRRLTKRFLDDEKSFARAGGPGGRRRFGAGKPFMGWGVLGFAVFNGLGAAPSHGTAHNITALTRLHGPKLVHAMLKDTVPSVWVFTTEKRVIEFLS